MPIMIGLGLGALIGGGTAALTGKDPLKGALIGAAGGALGDVFMGPAADVGTATAGGLSEAGATANAVNAYEAGLPGMTEGSIGAATPVTSGGLSVDQANQLMQTQAPTGLDALKANPVGFLKDNKWALAGGALGGMMAPATTSGTGIQQNQGQITPYTYKQGINPAYTGAGSPYFNQSYTPKPVTQLADGGIAQLKAPAAQQYTAPTRVNDPSVAAYNNMLAAQAQKEYVNSPQLAAFQSRIPGQGVQAPVSTGIVSPTGGIKYDPVAHQYVNATPVVDNTSIQPGITPLTDSIESRPFANYGSANTNAKGGQIKAYAAGGGIGGYYPSPDDGQGGQHPTDTGITGAHPSVSMGPAYPMQGISSQYAQGGDVYNLGSYSDGGRLLKGPGDGVSDDIPAQIGHKQPARLADGEFVVPARIVSELGNGSTDAGAKRLYQMMERIQANRKKSIGKDKVAVNSKSDKYLPA